MSRATTDLQHQFYDMLQQSQFWSPEQLRDYQREQLDQLLRHARANVPFYATRLDPVFKPNGDIDWDRWGEIPIVNRTDLIERRDAMQATVQPPGHGRLATFQTSGSTGHPVTTTHNGLASLGSRAAMFRAYGWHGMDCGGQTGSWYGDDPTIGTPDNVKPAPWGPTWDPRARDGRLHELNRLTPADEVVTYAARNGLDYFFGGATDMRLLAHETRRLDLPLRFDAIMTRSAVLSDDGRALLQSVFGARVYSLYSSKEGHKMAHPCPVSGRYHVNSEIILVEILDADGVPVAPGETGRVVITPFLSTAQPLVRYEQGDFAVAGRPCACGRGLQVIDDILGRAKHLFRLPDGRTIVPRLSVGTVTSLNAALYQIAQVAPTAIEVRYVPSYRGAPADEAAVRAGIATDLHPGMEVRFVRLDGFDTAVGQKHMEYVSELNEADAGGLH